MLPSFLRVAARLVARDDLDQDAAGAPLRPLARVDLADGQADAGRGLLRLGEVLLGAEGQGLALDRRHALVAVHVGPLVQGHDEDAAA